MNNYNVAAPLSILNIRFIVDSIMKEFNITDVGTCDLLKLIDRISEKYNDDLILQILNDKDRIFIDCDAKIEVTSGILYIKQSVVKKLKTKNPCRARFTICHELGHYFFHRRLGFSLYRSNSKNIDVFRNPE
ncbi:hypothetical protein FACS189459_7030 [Bacilli bacterium]|nr:hypothetical protein FACS189459_7030 [Bacilli bacterium]